MVDQPLGKWWDITTYKTSSSAKPGRSEWCHLQTAAAALKLTMSTWCVPSSSKANSQAPCNLQEATVVFSVTTWCFRHGNHHAFYEMEKWHLPNIWISFWSSQWEIRDTKNMPKHQPATFFFKRWRLVAHGASCNGSWISRLMEKQWRRCKAEKLTWSRACCHPSSIMHSIPVAQQGRLEPPWWHDDPSRSIQSLRIVPFPGFMFIQPTFKQLNPHEHFFWANHIILHQIISKPDNLHHPWDTVILFDLRHYFGG